MAMEDRESDNATTHHRTVHNAQRLHESCEPTGSIENLTPHELAYVWRGLDTELKRKQRNLKRRKSVKGASSEAMEMAALMELRQRVFEVFKDVTVEHKAWREECRRYARLCDLHDRGVVVVNPYPDFPDPTVEAGDTVTIMCKLSDGDVEKATVLAVSVAGYADTVQTSDGSIHYVPGDAMVQVVLDRVNANTSNNS